MKQFPFPPLTKDAIVRMQTGYGELVSNEEIYFMRTAAFSIDVNEKNAINVPSQSLLS